MPVNIFTEVESDDDLGMIYKPNGSGLILISDPGEAIITFEDIIDGEKYYIYSYDDQSILNHIYRVQNRPIEAEIATSLKNYLINRFKSKVIELPTDLPTSDGQGMEEWFAAYLNDDVLYLCEAREMMTCYNLPKIAERVKEFKEKFQVDYQKRCSVHFTKVVGVACGNKYHDTTHALELDLVCVETFHNGYNTDGSSDYLFSSYGWNK